MKIHIGGAKAGDVITISRELICDSKVSIKKFYYCKDVTLPVAFKFG